MDDALKSAVTEASGRPQVLAAVDGVYAALAEEVARRRPVCDASGRCCRFEEYGHRLYVTTAELAAFVNGMSQLSVVSGPLLDESRRPLPVLTTDHGQLTTDNTGCPFQAGRLCGAHAIRPFGCRIFYCDPAAEDWQAEAYERFHAELKAIHDRFEIPYFYVEWRRALAALGIGGGAREALPLSPAPDSL